MHSDKKNSGPTGRCDHPSFSWNPAVRAKPAFVRDREAFAKAMANPRFPRSAKWCPEWLFHNTMGPVNLWCTEALTNRMDLQPGDRVLDLGCGTAASSIFLALEFGVEVWAADLWIDPDENQRRIDEAQCASRIHPLRAEAKRLPFEHGFFDAVISIDAYHYFGTDIRYLSYLSQFVRVGGTIAMISPGNLIDPDDPRAVRPDARVSDQLGADWFTFRSASWWARHWGYTPSVELVSADMLDDGTDDWRRWADAELAAYGSHPQADLQVAMLESEAGSSMSFAVVLGKRNERPIPDLGIGDYENRIA